MSRRFTLPFLAVVLLLSFVGAAFRRHRPTIVLISVDTLRADHLSAYGYPKRTSRFIDSVAERGLLFENVLVTEPMTSPSHASLLTGVTPWKHGVITNGFRMKDGVDTLAAALRRAGYDTAGVVAIAHLGDSRGFRYGFNQFSAPPPLLHSEVGNEHRRDADVINAEAKRAIDGHVRAHPDDPMFLFVHYFDCHYPYRSWDKNEDQTLVWTPAEQQNTPKQIRRYDDGITWIDRHIEDLAGYVRAKIGNDVVLVITADHGEQIGDHDVPVNHADIYRETVQVPLVMAGPGIESDRVAANVSQLDVPVALARLGGAELQNAVDGIDALRFAERETSWLHRLFGRREEERAFVVTGAPAYSRSIVLVKGPKWFIKNFDSAYRYARIQTPAPSRGGPAKRLTGTSAEGQTSYTVDIRHYRPFWVTFQHVASSPACAATALVTIDPGLDYYRQPTSFKGSIRITVPAARWDSVTLSIAPAACAGVTSYEVSRQSPPGTSETPDLFNYLVARRLRSGDELYDAKEDPRMLRNLLQPGAPPPFEQELRSLFESYALRVPAQKIPPEYLQTLKSLGYL